ncbi:chemotaxis protein CheW [Aphanothece hegewaldii CCALA 016]|uniref:Chemotaxis protein CheW n=1 Tax=Aphanothece hegewaldii CCALA 016 TaxID=2107694 RepID=A0A2T1LUK8_9CHRO|nr:chemotaxis protein CheW [Aphanothece hegewaldii]PSF35248.1 chemotaxis protein CheW [Aphanothece hegewaldii CCALA 016]
MDTFTTNESSEISNINFIASKSPKSLSKFLLFQVGKLSLALSVDLIQKVINYTPVFGSGLGAFGVAHIGDQEITVIDLHQQFFKISQTMNPGQKGYLILVSSTMGETFALWVAQTPTLIDVALSQIRVLPDSYRRSDTLGAASHVMLISHETETMTVFILDVNRLVGNR